MSLPTATLPRLTATVPDPAHMAELLALSNTRHRHLCPRQVLGVRVGLAGGLALGLDLPRTDKRLLVIAETDGCFISGVQAATGLSPNRRTLRIADLGKVAATLVDTHTGTAVRIAPQVDIRGRACNFAPGQTRRYFAMRDGYQLMPDDQLLRLDLVTLHPPLDILLGQPGVRVHCDACGEEIINQREVERDGQVLCQTCAGFGYYSLPTDQPA